MVFWNALYIPTMKHHLIPPFILQEAGITENDVPKIHCEDPTLDDHTVWIDSLGVRFPLEFDGVFSQFKTRKPTREDIDTATS